MKRRIRRFTVAGLWLLVFAVAATQPSAGGGGGTALWEPEQPLAGGRGEARITFNFARSIAVVGDTVHVVWYDTRDGASEVYYKRSTDGGKTWGGDTRLSTGPGSNEHPAVAAAGPHVYAVWHCMREGQGFTVFLRRSEDGGANWEPETPLTISGKAAHASIAASGAAVLVSWGDARSGEAEMYSRGSADSGISWSQEVRISDLPFDSWVPTVELSGNDAYAAWVDTRDGNEEEYFSRSTDGGRTWGPNLRLTKDRMNSWAPSMAVSGMTVHFAWFDQKDDPLHPLDAEKELDQVMAMLGLKAEPEPAGVLVPNPNEAAKRRAEQKLRKISESADGWVKSGGDRRKLQDILHEFQGMAKPKGLDDAIARLREAMEMVGLAPTSPPPGAGQNPDLLRPWAEATVKQIQQAGPAWVQRGGDPKRLEAKLHDFEQALGGPASYMAKERKLDEALAIMGISFTPTTPPDVPKGYYMDAMGPRVADKMAQIQKAGPAWVQRGGDPHQLEAALQKFQQYMQAATHEWEIYYRRSADGGKSWGPDVRLTRAAGLSQRPSIARSGHDLHVVWFDDRDGNTEAYYKHSADGGTTWGPDVRLTHAPGDSMHPSVAVFGRAVHVVWFDTRNGHAEIYYRRGEIPAP